MLQGLRTAIYPVGDLAAAKAWYSQVIGHPPYFDQPFYVGFNVGGFELGLVPDGTRGWSTSVPRCWTRSRTWATAFASHRCAIRSATGSASSRIRTSSSTEAHA